MVSFFKTEDPETPLLKRNLRGLQILLMFTRDESTFMKIKQTLFVTYLGLFLITEYIELWIVRSNPQKALSNLSFTILASVTYLKTVTFMMSRKKWISVTDYVIEKEKEQRDKSSVKVDAIIQKIRNSTKKFDNGYAFIITVSLLINVLSPYVTMLLSEDGLQRIRDGLDPYPEIKSSWVPFDKSHGYGYYILTTLQLGQYIWGGILIWSYDSTVFKIMTFCATQFKLLRLNCENIFGDGSEVLSSHEIKKRIKDCHLYHVNMFKNINSFADLLRPVLFFYILQCSLLICACATRFTSQAASARLEHIYITEYLMAVVLQLFLYCWHSTLVSDASEGVEYSVFASAWCGCGGAGGSVRVRRSLLLLAGQLRRRVVFTAGPFTAINLATFITIMQGSYSYYTMANQRKESN